MKFSFDYKKKEINLDVKKCISPFSIMSGLMFRKNSKPLLFIFKKQNRQSIHSIFCVPFIIIWFNKNKIIEVKKVNPFKFFIRPKKKFDKFLEIPINNEIFNFFS